MFGKNKKFILSGFLVIIFIFGLFQISLAAVPDDIKTGLENTAQEANISTGGNVTNLIGNVVGAILSFIGVIFFALMVFGGFMWMTARGKEEQTKKAMGTITAAVIGLVIILSSYAITNVVFQNTYLTPTPPTSEEESSIDPKDVACDTAHKGWRCGNIDKCAEYGTKIEDFYKSEADKEGMKDIYEVKKLCEDSGKNNCLYATSTEANAKPLCETPKGENVQVCCQPQDESQKKYDWCFVMETGKCEKLESYGTGRCTDPSKAIPSPEPLTEKDCYLKFLDGRDCREDSYCNTSVTNFICVSGNVEGDKVCTNKQSASSGLGGGLCESTRDCETGVCKNGVCTFLTENCLPNTSLGGLMCGAVACGKADADVVCDDDLQCASKHCVNNKCEAGEKGSSCENSNDCEAGYFCSSRSTPSCCLPKLDRGAKCYGNNEACNSRVCIDKIGLEDVCQ